MIKNIIFDLSEVIISGYFGVEQLIEEQYGIPAEDFINRKQKETLNIFLDTMRGKYSEDEYFSYLLEGTNWDISVKDLKQIIRKGIKVPLPGVMPIIQELNKKYKLILLSDYVKEWKEYISENNADLAIFKYQYYSFDYNRLKHDKGTFQFILNDLNIKPEETLFIDDLEQNVQRALENGIKGIVFKDANQLRAELIKMNVLLSNDTN